MTGVFTINTTTIHACNRSGQDSGKVMHIKGQTNNGNVVKFISYIFQYRSNNTGCYVAVLNAAVVIL